MTFTLNPVHPHCAPFNAVSSHASANKRDNVCRTHDIRYGRYQDKKGYWWPYFHNNRSDKKLIDDPDVGWYKYPFILKRALAKGMSHLRLTKNKRKKIPNVSTNPKPRKRGNPWSINPYSNYNPFDNFHGKVSALGRYAYVPRDDHDPMDVDVRARFPYHNRNFHGKIKTVKTKRAPLRPKKKALRPSKKAVRTNKKARYK